MLLPLISLALVAVVFQGCGKPAAESLAEKESIILHPRKEGEEEEKDETVPRPTTMASLLQTFGPNAGDLSPATGKKWNSWDKVLNVDREQQAELNKDYYKMLQFDDPDDVEKATQLAWLKMELEDRKFLQAEPAPRHRRSQQTSQLQLQSTSDHLLTVLNPPPALAAIPEVD